ncbi:MAG: glucose-6-phosphate isomerase [Acidobacteriota bacterium]
MDTVLTQLVTSNLASRIWRRDPEAFVGDGAAPAVYASIRNRLGWLDAPSGMVAHVEAVTAFVDELARDGMTDIYLLGMGGSSLCAEVLRDVLGASGARNRLIVLDTTDERTIRHTTEALVPTRSCFLVSSKSGSTIEVTSLERHFWSVMSNTVPSPGRHFAAITDANTELVTHAANSGYRHTFINPSDIGGRYSALSLFGLVPAALVGIAPGDLIGPAQAMADQCRLDDATNPGLRLGAFIGGHARTGRDKMTVLAPSSLEPLGAWIEQLVAESTGKLGKGILPVVSEPIGPAEEYGDDRAFVAVLTPDSNDVRKAAAAFEAAGHPVFRIDASAAQLGAEFFRWEFATAVAGAVLELNPFDEPDVRSAKVHTQAQLDAQRTTGAFRVEPPFEQGPGYSRRERLADAPSAAGRPYLAILDYLSAEDGRRDVIERLRAALRQRGPMATTYGVGPRYLHSTGQYHKGGPNTGVFLLLTSADEQATPVPGMSYSFSTLKHAQAFGDFDALAAVDRRVIHYHFENPHADFAAELEKVVLGLNPRG